MTGRRDSNIDRHWDEITGLYLNNFESTVSLGKRFGVCGSTIERRLKQAGIPVRQNGNLTENHSAFNMVPPDMLYWLGYLAGDGCVTHNAQGELRVVCITSVDREHIQKFLDFLSSHSKISPRTTMINGKKYLAHGAKITSERIVNKLISLGITPRKSKTISMSSQSLVSTEDFLRGIIDSDGSLYITTDGFSPKISITTASQKFSQQLSIGIQDVFSEKCGNYSRDNSGTCRQIVLSGKRILPILHRLYSGNTISLNRKKDTALRILERFGYAEI